MQIKRLRLTGFKSFVEPTVLPIERGLTGIVGPNGCGKSNLLEAIRWVMGESSPKSMRGGGMEDVIFAGTATRPARDFAEVMLFAEREPDEAMPALDPGPDGELEIIRRIERGAGSAYRANGRDVRAKDIALIFADAATGPHSPALVSQGKVAAVIAAKPAERRAMLEEAAGISGLHVRRRDAEQKLRATEANLARLADILTEMDGRAGTLRRQAKAAERYTELSARITLAEARMLFARHREASAIADDAAHRVNAAENSVRAAQEAQLGAAAYTNDAVATLAQRRIEASKARDAANEARHQQERLEAERDMLARRLADLATQLRQIENDRAREDTLATDAAAAIGRLDEEEAMLAGRIKQAMAQRPDFSARIAEAERESRDAEVAHAQALARQASQQAERRVAEAARASSRLRLERLATEAERIATSLADLPDTQASEARRTAAESQRAAALSAREQADAAIAAADADRQEASTAQAGAQRALAMARATLAALDSEAAALAKATSRRDQTARALDTIKVQPGFERALAAAFGDDLDAVIAQSGPMRWTGAEATPQDPLLPEGAVPLASGVLAPPQLARRLAQIFVVEKDEGQLLAVGQRLVTRAGIMRRWDGFVVEDAGAAAADRFIRLNRLEAITRERPAQLEAVEAATTAMAATEVQIRDAAMRDRRARDQARIAQEELRQAERVLAEVANLLERVAQRRADLDRRGAEIAEDVRAAEKDFLAAKEACETLPAHDDLADEVAQLDQVSKSCRQRINQLQTDRATSDRTIAADKERQSAVRNEASSWRSRAGDAARRLAEMSGRESALRAELAELEERPAILAAQLEAVRAAGENAADKADAASTQETQAQATLQLAEQKLASANEALSGAREQRAGAVARAENAVARRIEIAQTCGERFGCPPPVLAERHGFDGEDIGAADAESTAHDRHSADRERLGPVNLVAASELAELEETQARSRAESEELTSAVNQLRGSIGSLNREGRQRLLAAFEAVNGHFQRLFTTLFNGGQAHLALIDSDDPLEAGLEIMAQPPGKRLTTLTLLSGGEQALTAVALIFGLFLTNPAPICVLDEVDAPLDDANVERFCDLLDRMVADTATRYLIVTHNAVTMSRMHRLLGVTMIEQGVSRLVSVDLEAAAELVAAE
jgi:chromosome segregation protein